MGMGHSADKLQCRTNGDGNIVCRETVQSTRLFAQPCSMHVRERRLAVKHPRCCNLNNHASARLQLLTCRYCRCLQPAVIVAHTAVGPQEAFITDIVHDLATRGYAAFALDLFGAGRCVAGAEKHKRNSELKQNRGLIAERALAAVQAVQKLDGVESGRLAAVGFCLGGQCVMDLMRAAPLIEGAALRGVVSFHGILDAWPHPPGPSTARVLAFHGYADPFVSEEMVTGFCGEMEERGVDYEVRLLGAGVMHAFMRPDKTAPMDAAAGLRYDARIAARAWHATLAFLNEVLRS
jgi:dienelactone hydrolase